MRQVRQAALIGAVFLATIPSGSAFAAFGGPSNEALLTSRDLWSRNQRLSSSAPEYTPRVNKILAENMIARQPVVSAIGALRQQISAQLSGIDPVDASKLQALAHQIFALRRQLDLLDDDREASVRAALTPAELAQVAQRHRQFVSVNTERSTLDNPEQYPESAYSLGDLFGDNLGASRGVSLSADQLQRQQAIKDSYTAIFQSIQQQRKTVHHSLFDRLAGTAAVTAADLAPLQQQASVLKDQLDTQRLAMAIELRAVLTPAQLAKSAELRTQLAALHTQIGDTLLTARTENTTATP